MLVAEGVERELLGAGVKIIDRQHLNRLLDEISLQIRNRISYLSIDVHDDTAGLAEHRIILEKLVAGDADGAKAAMEQHVRMLRDSIFERLMDHSY